MVALLPDVSTNLLRVSLIEEFVKVYEKEPFKKYESSDFLDPFSLRSHKT